MEGSERASGGEIACWGRVWARNSMASKLLNLQSGRCNLRARGCHVRLPRAMYCGSASMNAASFTEGVSYAQPDEMCPAAYLRNGSEHSAAGASSTTIR